MGGAFEGGDEELGFLDDVSTAIRRVEVRRPRCDLCCVTFAARFWIPYQDVCTPGRVAVLRYCCCVSSDPARPGRGANALALSRRIYTDAG